LTHQVNASSLVHKYAGFSSSNTKEKGGGAHAIWKESNTRIVLMAERDECLLNGECYVPCT